MSQNKKYLHNKVLLKFILDENVFTTKIIKFNYQVSVGIWKYYNNLKVNFDFIFCSNLKFIIASQREIFLFEKSENQHF